MFFLHVQELRTILGAGLAGVKRTNRPDFVEFGGPAGINKHAQVLPM
jgi:hypothetical protein